MRQGTRGSHHGRGPNPIKRPNTFVQTRSDELRTCSRAADHTFCSIARFQASSAERRTSRRRPNGIDGKGRTPSTRPCMTLYTCAFEQRSSLATSTADRISSLDTRVATSETGITRTPESMCSGRSERIALTSKGSQQVEIGHGSTKNLEGHRKCPESCLCGPLEQDRQRRRNDRAVCKDGLASEPWNR